MAALDVLASREECVGPMAMKSGVRGSIRRLVMRRDGYRCRNCGLRGREFRRPRGGHGFPTDVPGVYLSIDHVVPRCRGGSSEPDNLQVLCVPCNTKKGVG